MTASSTTPPDNVFLHLWLFFKYIFMEYVHSTFVPSASLTSLPKKSVSSSYRLAFAIRGARQTRVSPPPEGAFDTPGSTPGQR